MDFRRVGLIFLLSLFAVSSLIFTYTLLQFALLYQDSNFDKRDVGTSFLSASRLSKPDTRHDFTYVDDDFPSLFPDFDPGYVELSVEETVRFSLWDPEAAAEWSTTSPPGEGAERLGPDQRLFYLSMFHELHCVRQFHQILRNPGLTESRSFVGHAQHCLNYLRQCSLCQADRTLERGDFVTRNLTESRIGATHTCKDWRAVYDKVTYDWSIWDAGLTPAERS